MSRAIAKYLQGPVTPLGLTAIFLWLKRKRELEKAKIRKKDRQRRIKQRGRA